MGFLSSSNSYQATTPQMFYDNPVGKQQHVEFLDVQKQQQALASVLRDQMAGKGPNAAQAQYKQNLDQVAAQQAGAIASQKGISPALAARLIANQGAQAQMQGAGQAATLQAQQQLAAQQQLQAQQAQMAGQALNYNQLIQGASTQGHLGAQGINAGIASQNTQAANQFTMGGLQGGASALGLSAFGGGKYDGGQVYSLGSALMNGGAVPGKAKVNADSPKNDTVHAMLSPGEIVIPRSLADNPERAKKFIEELLKSGDKPSYGKVLEAKRKAKA